MKSTTSLYYAVVGPVRHLMPPSAAAAQNLGDERVLVQRTTGPAPSGATRFANVVGHLAEWFWDAFENAERNRRERWLAQATDIYDLERRMQDLERRSARGAF